MEVSYCCEAAVHDYSSLQYPEGVIPMSRCTECGEMSMVLNTKDFDKEDYNDPEPA